MKTRYLIVTIILVVVLLASPVYLHLGNNQLKPVGGSKTYWKSLAASAWEYFQPGKGVDSATGLHMASLGWPHFTDWDLGIYIQAIIDAEKIGILSADGEWGANKRLEKLLSFLENREITPEGLPYWWYNSDTGLKWGDGVGNVVDTGKLLVALDSLRLYRSDLASSINQAVYERMNYTRMFQEVDQMAGSPNIYNYYVARGFSSFWPERFSDVAEGILNSIVSAPKVETYGVKLPLSLILCEPLLYSVFELRPDVRVLELTKQVYLAHESRYNATGKYAAFSEGNTGLDSPSFVYEWVVTPANQTWVIKDSSSFDVNITPIVYLKVAVGFLALYETEFTEKMMRYLEVNVTTPSKGFMDGIDENGRVVSTIIDKTNGLVIEAARYAIENRDFAAFPWHNGNLNAFPWPFIQDSIANNTAIVIGENKPHGPVGAGQTTDAIAGMLIMETLARGSSNGSIRATTDSWITEYDSKTANVTLLDNTTDLIIVGSPETNAVSYYYNSLRDRFGEPLVPVQFVPSSVETPKYLYVPSSGSTYKLDFDEQGNLLADYGIVMAFQDQFERNVFMIYGLGTDGTLAASQVLKDYLHWNLRGCAVIVKSYPDKLSSFPTNSSIIEVVY